MPRVKFNRATLLPIEGTTHDPIEHDDATEVIVLCDVLPDFRTTRWDGDKGMRPAAQEEIAAWDEAKQEAIAAAEIDVSRGIKVAMLVMRDEMNAIRAALVPPMPARSLAQIRRAFIDKWKATP